MSKGYGKILLNHIGHYLKEKGISYIVLIPSSNSLIEYYGKLGYIQDIFPINIEENIEIDKYNNYIAPNICMYKKI